MNATAKQTEEKTDSINHLVGKVSLLVNSSGEKRQKRLTFLKGLSFVDKRYAGLIDYFEDDERTIEFEIIHDSKYCSHFVKKGTIGTANDLLDLVDHFHDLKLKNVKIFGAKQDGMYPVLVISQDSKIGLTLQSKPENNQFENNEIYYLIKY